MKVAIARHNGLGDLVMAMPFIITLCDAGHDVTIETDISRNLEWLNWLAPKAAVVNCRCDPYTDFRQHQPGFDRLLNFNRLELVDSTSRRLGGPYNWQEMMLTMIAAAGLPVPADLSPSKYVRQSIRKSLPAPGRGGVLVFAKSSHPSRRLCERSLECISQVYPKALVDPRFPGLLDLFKAVHSASLVIGCDTGAVHVAEAMGTRWLCVHTTFDEHTRHKHYLFGTALQAHYPCYSHDWCDGCMGASLNDGYLKQLREQLELESRNGQ